MARAIISCTGEVFNIGDKVLTPSGTVIRVQGAAIGQVFYNAEKCTKVHPSVPTTAEKRADDLKRANKDAGPDAVKDVSGAADSDCVIWGN